MATIKRLNENCPWCNRKTIGQDESGFKSCVKCDYDSNHDRHLDLEESSDRSYKIYDALICGESNKKVRFTTSCSKLKGHKGKHKDNDHPDFEW